MSAILQVVTTIDSEARARAMAESLVREHSAACVQIDGPITSIYRWQGKLETAQEWRCTIKTTADRFEALERQIRALHSYEVPEIVATEVARTSAAYAEWLRQQTQRA